MIILKKITTIKQKIKKYKNQIKKTNKSIKPKICLESRRSV
jgi:peptidoglycan hydrolase CwlO-like protein